MNKINCTHTTNRSFIAGSLVLPAILFASFNASAQIPKLFHKFIEKQNKIQSGYVKMQTMNINDHDTIVMSVQESFFILTHKDFKHLSFMWLL